MEKVDKRTAARILEEVATLLELRGENPFKCRAYHNAARTVLTLQDPLEELVESGKLQGIKGIGSTLAGQIEALVREGRLPLHRELLAYFPAGFLDLLQDPLRGTGHRVDRGARIRLPGKPPGRSRRFRAAQPAEPA